MVEAKLYLDKNYPKEKRGEIFELDISKKGLEGHLDLSDFSNLKILRCYYNKLTNLDISNCENLEEIYCASNLIEKNLASFSHLKNLRVLDLGYLLKTDLGGGTEIPIWPGESSSWWMSFSKIHQNNFFGSLKSLENCKKLEFLCIACQTNIIGGLEYLPSKNLTHFGCHFTSYEKIVWGHEELKEWQTEFKKLSEPKIELKKALDELKLEKRNKDLEIETAKKEAAEKFANQINQLNETIKEKDKELRGEIRKKNWALFASSIQGLTKELMGDKWGERANQTIQFTTGISFLRNAGEWTYEVWLIGIGVGLVFVVPRLYNIGADMLEKWAGVKLPRWNAKDKISQELDKLNEKAKEKAINVIVNLQQSTNEVNAEQKELNQPAAISKEEVKPEEILPQISSEKETPFVEKKTVLTKKKKKKRK